MSNHEKIEIMSLGSNQVNVNGEIISKTHWEGYSPDGKQINLNFYSNGKEGKIRNLDLNDFGFLLRESLKKDSDEMGKIKRQLNPLTNEFKEILKKRKFKNVKDTLSLQKNKSLKKKKKQNKKTKKKR